MDSSRHRLRPGNWVWSRLQHRDRLVSEFGSCSEKSTTVIKSNDQRCIDCVYLKKSRSLSLYIKKFNLTFSLETIPKISKQTPFSIQRCGAGPHKPAIPDTQRKNKKCPTSMQIYRQLYKAKFKMRFNRPSPEWFSQSTVSHVPSNRSRSTKSVVLHFAIPPPTRPSGCEIHFRRVRSYTPHFVSRHAI